MEEKKSTIEKVLEETKKNNPPKERDPLFFLAGAALLIIGLFILSKNILVTTGFASFTLWGYNLTSGLLVFPLIFGLIWLFYNPKSLGAKILSIVGTVIIIVAVISSILISLMHMTLYDYILIIGMIAAGIGMLLRYYFKKA